MNPIPPQNETASHRVEFFRLPQARKRDPFFGLSRAWYYKAAAAGEIRMIAVRQRGAMRGVRLVAYDSVADYIRRSAELSTDGTKPSALKTRTAAPACQQSMSPAQLPISFE